MKPAENRSPAPATRSPKLTLRLPMVKTAKQGTNHRLCFLPHVCHEALCICRGTHPGAVCCSALVCLIAMHDSMHPSARPAFAKQWRCEKDEPTPPETGQPATLQAC